MRTDMKRLRVVGATLLVLAASTALPGFASEEESDAGLPFTSTLTNETCDEAAVAAGPENCHVDARASAATRRVSAEAGLVSPGLYSTQGALPWRATANSTSKVVATYEVTEPVPRLDFLVTVRILDAQVRLAAFEPIPGFDRTFGAGLGRYGYVTVGGYAIYPDCPLLKSCGGGGGQGFFLYNSSPGTTKTVSGHEVVFPLGVSRKDGDLLPGELSILVGVSALTSHNYSFGEDAATIDAVVTKVELVR